MYDKMSEFLRKLMGRFLKKDAYEKNFGSDLVSIDCNANSQLPDADNAIGEATKKALAQIKPDGKSLYILASVHFIAHRLHIYGLISLFRTLS